MKSVFLLNITIDIKIVRKFRISYKWNRTYGLLLINLLIGNTYK